MNVTLPSNQPFCLHATLIHSISSSHLKCLRNILLVVDADGKITHLLPNIPPSPDSIKNTLPNHPPVTILPWPRYFLVPSFIDTHVHAPQYDMRGLGSARGMEILEWLDEITFPEEARFEDVEHAKKVYGECVRNSLKQGVGTACYYASLHTEATKILADTCLAQGQRAFIGKTCMDNATTNPPHYRETTPQSLRGTQEVIQNCFDVDPTGSLVRPIITPRFAISCTPDSLKGLGDILAQHSRDYAGKGLLMQTHFCEAQSEVSATLQQYPDFKSEVDLYQHFGLLNDRSVLAHCTTVTSQEIQQMKDFDVGVSHCPVANCTVGGGFMAAPIRKYLDLGMKVGLGTDSGGGYSGSILDAMRQAVIVGNADLRDRSKRKAGKEGGEGRIGLEEVFYMATLGGARVLGLDEEIGKFEVGRWFDAVVVDCEPGMEGGDEGVMTKVEEGEGWERVLEKFVMTGDDRNVRGLYVNGVKRKG